ncbi:MAG: hypothetical protein ACOX9R_08730 [Armatimonadota bacterium]
MKLPVFILVPLLLICLAATAVAQDEETEEEPYDERGFIVDEVRIALSFTRGSTERYDYDDLRIYLDGGAHYAFKGDDYLDWYLLINRLDRSYDDPRYSDEPIRNIFNSNLTYVIDGVDKETYGFNRVIGASFFSDNMFDDVNAGFGYGCLYNYDGGNLRAMAGVGRNLGYSDSWSPLADLAWTHNQRLGNQWRLRTRADIMWNENRAAADDSDGYPDTIFVVDGTVSYEVVKGWSLYARYFNDNASASPRSYISLGVNHRYVKPRPRR